MNVLLVDAFDSFSYIIYQYLSVLGLDVTVVRSGVLSTTEIRRGRHEIVVLGPGPGHPSESGHVEIVREVGPYKPIMGVCLGHQSIGVAFGATVRPANHIMHGKTSRIQHDGEGMFAGFTAPIRATRYHSLIIDEKTLPAELVVTAVSADDGYVMGVRHRELPIEGVQFHPESVLTERGLDLFRGFVTHTAAGRVRPTLREQPVSGRAA